MAIPKLYTVKEAAAALNLSEATVYNLLKSGALKRFRPRNIHGPRHDLRVTRITEGELADFVRDNEREVKSDDQRKTGKPKQHKAYP